MHKSWYIAIFYDGEWVNEFAEVINYGKFVGYGWPSWPSRSEWIVPGTIGYGDC